MAKLFIGVDAGGTKVKVAAFDAEGHELGCEHRPNPMTFPHPGWTERDPDAMWRNAAAAIRDLLERMAIDPADVGRDRLAPGGWQLAAGLELAPAIPGRGVAGGARGQPG